MCGKSERLVLLRGLRPGGLASAVTDADFDACFEALTGNAPFRWQKRLFFEHFATNELPQACDLSTGLGKTSVMAIWLIAITLNPALPRRLVYVVDRRAVVDQATRFAEQLRDTAPAALNIDDLPISTLRGQFADNRRWLDDPSAPAIIVGTIDMIGSRLLFEGYGVSRKMRPYQAGLLGADSLVVLDEAHLCPPFESLMNGIAVDAKQCFGPCSPNDRDLIPPFRVLSLSATGRNESRDAPGAVFRLEPEDRDDPEVAKRLSAGKRLTIDALDDATDLVAALVDRACRLATEPEPARVLVYCHSRNHAVKAKNEIVKRLDTENRDSAELLVGGRRVFERQALQKWLDDHGFLSGIVPRPQQPTFLIATSAGEVGIDLDANHMVCDLVAIERMIQRLGRVNRRGGDHRTATVDVIAVSPPPPKATANTEAKNKYEFGCDQIAVRRAVLEQLPQGGDGRRDASPAALIDLKVAHPDLIAKATTPAPLRPALTRALVDAWSLTSIKQHTGRPEVQPWLRGWEKEEPQTTVIWRRHLPIRARGGEATSQEIEAFFEAAPPHASEILETETNLVDDWLLKRATAVFTKRNRTDSKVAAAGSPAAEATATDAPDPSLLFLRRGDVVAFVLSPAGDWRATLRGSDLTKESKKENLAGATLVVDARFAGLSDGMLDIEADGQPRTIDDGGEWLPPVNDKPIIRFRVRTVVELPRHETDSDVDWRERLRFEVERTEDGEAVRWLIVDKWRHDAATEDDRSTSRLQELDEHQSWAENRARALARRIGLKEEYADMLCIAARLHDEGKRQPSWQRAFNAPRDGRVYAKTRGPVNVRRLDGYRHEFGSIPLAQKDPDFLALPTDLQDLALHLVAAHHGGARPVIATTGCADAPPSALARRACDVALRFARLQKRWGPWGLAWWEALLRAADQQASRDNAARKPVELARINITEGA